MERERVSYYPSLDYLRGWMAFAVLIFHVEKWQTGIWDPTTLQGKLGVYAVEIFFVLSGLTLTLVYQHHFSLKHYIAKRFARIFPLLWVVTICSLLIADAPVPWPDIVLNLTGLFGFIDASHDIATGAWSIGNELVFYTLFPILLLVHRHYARLYWGAAIGVLVFFYGFHVCENTWTNSDQLVWWPLYVQWYRHVPFFLAGMMMGLAHKQVDGWLVRYNGKMMGWVLFFMGLILYYYLVPSTPAQLAFGAFRVAFSILSIGIVWIYFTQKWQFSGWFHVIFGWLGKISYGLYLWHPIVFRTIKSMTGWGQESTISWPLTLCTIAGALVVAHASFYYFESVLLSAAHVKPQPAKSQK